MKTPRLASCALAFAGLLGTPMLGAQVQVWFGDVTPSENGFTENITQIAVHPIDGRRVIAAGLRVHVSSDGGATWRSPWSWIRGNIWDRLYAHKGTPGLVYLQRPGIYRAFSVGQQGELFRSVDFGESWTSIQGELVNEGFTLSPFASDPLTPDHILATTALPLACGIGCLFRTSPWQKSLAESHDAGRTWKVISEFPGSYYPGVVDGPTPAAPARLLITAATGFRVSDDGGHTWESRATTPPMRLSWIRQDPAHANVLYASGEILAAEGGAGIVRSDDGGTTWKTIYPLVRGSPYSGGYRAGELTIDPVRTDRLWLSGIENGLYLSENRGESWLYVGFRAEFYHGQLDHSSIPGRVFAAASDSPQAYMLRNGRIHRIEMHARPRVAIEYQYGDRYWLSADPGEAISQDHRGNEARRTGRRFGVWSAALKPAEAVGICRFQGNPAYGQGSRFIAVRGAECDIVRDSPGWMLEGENEFYAVPPGEDGGCPADLVAVRRFNNLQPNVNHRYVADPDTAQEMRNRGWYDEGVRMCARPLAPEEQQ